jgi:hypothetical protein
MADDSNRIELGKGERIVTGVPRVIPDKMLEELSRLCKSAEFVEEAYFGQIYIPSRKDKPHLIIQFKLSLGFERKFEEIASQSANVARGHLAAGEPFDIGVISNRPLAGLKRFYHR